jgi:hypothetical protein
MKKSIFTIAALVLMNLAANAQSMEQGGHGRISGDGGEKSSSMPDNQGKQVATDIKVESATRKEEEVKPKKEEKALPKKSGSTKPADKAEPKAH